VDDAVTTGEDTAVIIRAVANDSGTSSASVEVTVLAANDPPAAVDDVATVLADNGPTSIDVLGNDSTAPDPGESLTIIAVEGLSNGSVTIEGAALVYTPSAGFTGIDRFAYTVGDGHGGTATANVTVTVATP
jgi:hypothetical protein